MRLFVKTGADGEISPDRGVRRLKKPSREEEDDALGGLAADDH